MFFICFQRFPSNSTITASHNHCLEKFLPLTFHKFSVPKCFFHALLFARSQDHMPNAVPPLQWPKSSFKFRKIRGPCSHWSWFGPSKAATEKNTPWVPNTSQLKWSSGVQGDLRTWKPPRFLRGELLLGGGFKYFLFSSLPGGMIQFD